MSPPPEHRARDRLGAPDLGVGIGLRAAHYEQLMREAASPESPSRRGIDFLEVLSENHFAAGGIHHACLEVLAPRYPMVLHGVSLDLGGTDPLDEDYLRRLRALVDRVKPPWMSDHLCWTGVEGERFHELLPLPLTRAVAAHVAERVRRVSDALGVRVAVENVSSYLTFKEDELPEWAFVSEVAEAADCGILLDVNNVYVSAQNHGFDASAYLSGVARERVLQMHLAGFSDRGRYLLDTHAARTTEDVWSLYTEACRRVGLCSTLVEWDDQVPELSVMLAEVERARGIRAGVTP